MGTRPSGAEWGDRFREEVLTRRWGFGGNLEGRRHVSGPWWRSMVLISR